MKTQTKQKIIEYIEQKDKVRAHDLKRILNISSVALHKQLKTLVQTGKLIKLGKPPIVFYSIHTPSEILPTSNIKEKVFIEKNYLYISPRGELLTGVKGLSEWATNTKQSNLIQLSEEYITTRKQANRSVNTHGWIDATNRFNSLFPEKLINRVIYQDFYSLPKFGKTKLGQLVLYAKQSQNLNLINRLIDSCQPIIKKIIHHYHINAVVFIPPTIPRQIQLLKEFARGLHINLPTIDLVKVYSNDIPVAQKSLSKMEERIINARETIQIKSSKTYEKVLLIDDAIGSGATIHETAIKLKSQNLCEHVFAYAIVGSYKGFDVIREI